MKKKKFKKGLFIFRRDLRLDDNTGLMAALSQCEKVIPCFIFDPRQIGKENEYRSNNAIQFMIESLQDLKKQLKKKKGKLYLFYGEAPKVVAKLIKQENIDAVFFNKDYTPFALKRDEAIKKACLKNNIACFSFYDELLNEPNKVLTNNNDPYSIYSAYYKKATKVPVAKPIKCNATNFWKGAIKGQKLNAIFKKILKTKNKNILVHGGSQNTMKILRNLKNFKNYAKTRDFPSMPTTHLSASNKFGTASIRQVYWAIVKALGKYHPLIPQLYWRDFFTQVAYHSPFVFGQPFRKKYEKLKWLKSKKDFQKWCQGKTGFPIVDAGMRQLNTTGFMHNRVRMIVASFLVKDLHINWLWGEKYFAKQLVDYDPAVNNGNWQWCASTGCDSQPYFRIFNPWLQQKKFDPECKYIKKWIPELKNISPKRIHNWFKDDQEPIKSYPRPLVNHKKQAEIAKKMYKNV